jgi:hypothetical protein
MTPFQRKLAKLTPEEHHAIGWAKRNYRRGWRKHFSRTREQAVAGRPKGWDAETWGHIHDNPFGNEWMNKLTHTVRRLLIENRI